MNSYDNIAGVPLYYDRQPIKMDHRSFQMVPGFFNQLSKAFEALFSMMSAKPTKIITAGTYVKKPGMHGVGRAFDLDGLEWSEPGDTFQWWATDYEDPNKRAFYLGIQAIFMTHFGVVLAWEYNNAHHDHLHIDNSYSPEAFRKTRSQVTFVQAAVSYVFNFPVEIDGIWGPQTAGAAEKVINRSWDWRTFLQRVIQQGFSQENVAKALKDGVVSSPEPEPVKSKITEADVDKWLAEHGYMKVDVNRFMRAGQSTIDVRAKLLEADNIAKLLVNEMQGLRNG